MGVFYETTVHIGAAEAGLGLQCRPAGVLDILQEAATQAGGRLGVSGPEMMEKYHALWMVTRMWYHLDRPLMWDDAVDVRTWHRGGRGAMVYRDFDLSVGGEPVGEAVSVWVAVEADSRKVMRASDVLELSATGGGELCKARKLAGVRLPQGLTLAEERRFHYSDMDSNGHVNNARYGELIADAARLERRIPRQFVSTMQIGYLRECMAGETVGLYTAEEGRDVCVRGVGAEGESRFEALLTLEDLPGDAKRG